MTKWRNREKWKNRVKRKNELKTHVICEMPNWIHHFVCLFQLLTSDVFELHYKVCVLGLRPNLNVKSFMPSGNPCLYGNFSFFLSLLRLNTVFCFGLFYSSFVGPFWFRIWKRIHLIWTLEFIHESCLMLIFISAEMKIINFVSYWTY